MRRAKKCKNLSSARHYDQIRFRFRTAKTHLGPKRRKMVHCALALCAVLRGHEKPVHSAAYSPDGKRIITASFDNTARVWDAANGQQIALLHGHKDSVHSAAYSPDGARIVTASDDNTARIWNVRFASMSTRQLLTEVCTRRLRGLSKLTAFEIELIGYVGHAPEIDVCGGLGTD